MSLTGERAYGVMVLDGWDWFISLSEEESFTKAAERLQVSQQTLSARLNALEKALDVRLVTRSTPIALTPAGMVFLLYAREQKQAQQDMMREIGEVTGSGAGIIKIGISHVRSQTLMPLTVKKIRERWPKMRVMLIERTNRELLRMAEHGEVDAVIARFDDVHPGVELTPLYQEEIVIALRRDVLEKAIGKKGSEALAEMEQAGVSALKECPFVLGTLDDIAGRIGYSVLRNAGIKKPHIVAISENMRTLLGMAAEGLGAIFCPVNLVPATHEKGPTALLHFSLSKQARYSISLGIPSQDEQWSALSVMKECLDEALSELNMLH